MRLLLVEDDRALAQAFQAGLRLGGYVVDWVKRGDELLAAAGAATYSVILLDLGLPHMSGLEALAAFRARHDHTPVIIITAQDRPAFKVAGLDCGGDDYLVKPVDLDELLARIRAQIRRHDQRSSDVIAAGCIRLDLTGRTVTSREQDVAVTAKEYKILSLLMRRAGRFVSKGDLETIIYDDEVACESNTIEVSISALRRKLGRDAILTARGLGYMIAR
ncbi:response regulator transcription factor [Rhizorhabdus argentea]|uniref:response regulator transcription factor n=1 Tax=Rhizorhabdus argentea TaxID=1387174 RepID=UPI0030ED8233